MVGAEGQPRRASSPQPTAQPFGCLELRTSSWVARRILSHLCRSFAHVFEGGGFGIGLTVDQLTMSSAPSTDLWPSDQGWHPARLGELMPVAARTDAEMAEEMRRANIADSQLWAYRVEMI